MGELSDKCDLDKSHDYTVSTGEQTHDELLDTFQLS